jgi:hypothetical protein
MTICSNVEVHVIFQIAILHLIISSFLDLLDWSILIDLVHLYMLKMLLLCCFNNIPHLLAIAQLHPFQLARQKFFVLVFEILACYLGRVPRCRELFLVYSCLMIFPFL